MQDIKRFKKPHTNDELSGKKNRKETIPFTVASKTIKYLAIDLTNEV